MAKIKINVQGPEKKVVSRAARPATKKVTRHIAVTKFGEKKPTPKPAAKPAAVKRRIQINKPVVKKVTVKKATPSKKVVVKKPAPKPVVKKVEAKPAPKPVVKKVEAKPAPKPVVSSAISSITKSTVKVITTPKPAPKPVVKKVEAKPAPKPTPKPAPKRIAQHPISSSSAHRSVLQRSTTLSRRYVKRPTVQTRSDNLTKIVEVSASDAKKQERIALKKARTSRFSGFRARKKSIAPAKANETLIRSALKDVKKTEAPKVMEQSIKHKHRGRRIALALICSILVIGGLAAFVYFNMPDISVRVAAMQTGIEASYPSSVPRGYSLSNVTSDKDGIVTIGFTNSEGAAFNLTEEKSTWDSTALLNNYVKKTFPSDYATIREQGITIYYRGGNAAWVNGGMLYKINCTSGGLTKEQVRNIATSM